MKLNVFDRILLAIILIVAIFASFVLFGVAAQWIPQAAVNDFVALFYDFPQNAWILAGSALLLLLISVALLFSGREKKEVRSASTLIRQSEIGGTYISLSAIDTMVQKHCRQQSRVRDCTTTLRAVENGIAIGVRLSVLPDTDVVKLTEELQKSLKEYIESLTGVNVTEVGILVENTTPQGTVSARVE